jgi:hypothetical protein
MPNQVRLLSLQQICKAVRRSAPYVRALADSQVIDSYVSTGGWRAFPRLAIEQIKAHEARRSSATIDG